ncbi:sensor histidine kinase [Bacillus massilinigeriensis]|uniref:sensor histidine kinase n=1 Tax=Bacillus mediterraneensis TaxID=1805474 RepID=UPI0008F9439B|nr:sensor histidine kinase [Bacillus mediterraneensis]
MIKVFLRERASWIILILILHTLLILVSWLDNEIPLKPILYVIFLSLIIFTCFLAFRYGKESAFYRSLKEWENELDLTNLPKGHSPFEQIVSESIDQQTYYLVNTISKNKFALQQEKDDLLSWIHEIKTPLTAMRLMIDRLEDQELKSGLTYEWLRIHLLLDQQLHQKRIPFMENDLYIEKVNLKELLFKEIKTLQSWCMQKGIGFHIQLEAKQVVTDAKWLAFIVRQLMANAVKYSESDDILIESSVNDEAVILSITDFGRGIEGKDLSRIFDKGFTSTASRKDSAATGMGLYLAMQAAQPLLIRIRVASKVGEGSKFTLHFPRRNEFARITSM